MENKLYLLCERKVNGSALKVYFQSKRTGERKVSWRSVLLKSSPEGMRVLVDFIEYPSEEKLTQLKSHQQLCVPLLRTSMQRVCGNAKEELSHLRIWVTWAKCCCLLSWMTVEPMKRLADKIWTASDQSGLENASACPVNHFSRWKCTTTSSNLSWQRIADKYGRGKTMWLKCEGHLSTKRMVWWNDQEEVGWRGLK